MAIQIYHLLAEEKNRKKIVCHFFCHCDCIFRNSSVQTKPLFLFFELQLVILRLVSLLFCKIHWKFWIIFIALNPYNITTWSRLNFQVTIRFTRIQFSTFWASFAKFIKSSIWMFEKLLKFTFECTAIFTEITNSTQVLNYAYIWPLKFSHVAC